MYLTRFFKNSTFIFLLLFYLHSPVHFFHWFAEAIKLEIVDLQSLNKSTDGTLRAVRPDGDFVAKYSCSSFPVMDANLTWLMPEDFPSVPEGVELHYRSSETVLYWSRRLKPSDSGTYTCQLVQRKETSLGYLKLSVFSKLYGIGVVLKLL